MYTLGINAAFHDPAACLVQDGRVLAAAEEEPPDKADRIPAVRHVDGTARIQTINRQQNERYYDVLKAFMVATPDRVQLGDMARDGFAAVWNGAAYHVFRDRLSSDDPPEVCRSCAVYAGTF